MGINKLYAVYAASGVVFSDGNSIITPMKRVGISVAISAAKAIEDSYRSFTRKTASKDEQEPDYCKIEVVEFRDGLPEVMDSSVRELIRQESLRVHNCALAQKSLEKFLDETQSKIMARV